MKLPTPTTRDCRTFLSAPQHGSRVPIGALSTLSFLILFFIGSMTRAETERVTVRLDSAEGPVRHVHGLLHGTQASTVPQSVIDGLRACNLPYWRLKGGTNLAIADSIDAKVDLVVSDVYADAMGGYPFARPWLDWAGYEAILESMMGVIEQYALGIDYYDIWNEPDHPQFWGGTYAQLLEAYQRAIVLIRSHDPAARVVVPSTSICYPEAFMAMLDDLDSLGLRVDALSWHEFGSPLVMRENVLAMRDSLDTRDYGGGMEIHINEYAGPDGFVIPGQMVGWVQNFEASPVDWATIACWDVSDGISSWSTCWAGFSGLFHADEVSPLPAFWLHRFYGEMDGVRAAVTTTTDVSAFASRNDATQEVRVMVGRMKSERYSDPFPPEDVSFSLYNYPYSLDTAAHLVIQRVSNTAHFRPMLRPPSAIVDSVAFLSFGDSLSFTFADFADGDAYLITISPATIVAVNEHSIWDAVRLFPNPTDGAVRWSETYSGASSLKLFSPDGRLVLRAQVANQMSFELPEAIPSGVYLLELSRRGGGEAIHRKLVIR